MVSKLTKVIDRLIQEVLQSEDKIQIYNNTLCPEVWGQDGKINPEVRKALLKIALDFFKGAELNAKMVDIQLLGSLANYNWTPKSDLDTHIIVDATPLGMSPDDQEKYLRALVGKWNLEHEIKVKGHKVELYLQSHDEKNASTAVYSLKNNEWIKAPVKEKISIDKPLIQRKYTHWVERINQAVGLEDEKAMKKLMDKLKEYRQAGLDKNGEFSTENLVFKILRAKGVIEKLKTSMNAFYDQHQTVADGFDPQSQAGPNMVDPTTDNGDYYQAQNTRMRQLEANMQGKIVKSKLKMRQHPDAFTGIPNFEKFSLENLNSILQKANEMLKFAQKKGDEQWAAFEEQLIQAVESEMQRRMDWINKPVAESKFDDQILMGWVDPRTHEVLYGRGDEYSMHDQLYDKYPHAYQLDWDDSPKWRFRRDLNTVYWWGQMPHVDIKDTLDMWLKKNFKVVRPTHVRLRSLATYEDDIANIHHAHGTRENINEDGGAGMIGGGFGSGKRKEDRLAIKNDDGTLQKWRIRSKDVINATPPMEEWMREIVQEILDKHLPLPAMMAVNLEEEPKTDKKGPQNNE